MSSAITSTSAIPMAASLPKTAASSGSGFEYVLQLTSLPAPRPDLTSLADYLASDTGAIRTQNIQTLAQNAIERINTELKALLGDETMANMPPIIIQIDQTGHISLSDHPEKAKITQFLNENPDFEQTIRQAMVLQEQAAIISQYEAYLAAYYKAYAQGGAKAARAVTERYLTLTARFTYAIDAHGFTMKINGQSPQDWLASTTQTLASA